VRRPGINTSGAASRLEPCASSAGGAAVRLGLSYVRGIGDELATLIAAGQPYRDMEDLVRRTGVTSAQAEALATAGAFEDFGLSRRAALWSAGAVAAAGPGPAADFAAPTSDPEGFSSLCDAMTSQGDEKTPTPTPDPAPPAPTPRAPRLAGLVAGADAPPLPGMTPIEENQADLWATGLSAQSYPTEFARPALAEAGVVTAADLFKVPAGEKVRVAGVVTHRQRPATAQGVTFMNLEDETGLINVVCSAGAWKRYRRAARSSPALIIDGRLERVETVINVVVERIRPLPLAETALRSRDFR
jgi:error-prone DNA polymerase